MIKCDFEQGSDEWRETRLGISTASEFSKIITAVNGEYSKSAGGYMNKLIAEIITGKEATGFTSKWMDRGIEVESEARNWYSFTTGQAVEQVGFIYMDEDKRVGCSPDGLVGDKGLEIKCPSPEVMVGYLLKGSLPREYIPQVQGSMYVTGFKQWDFLAYHPDFDSIRITIDRDEAFIEKLHCYLARFHGEMAEKMATIKRKINDNQ